MELSPTENYSHVTVDLSEYLDGLYSYAMVLSRNPTEAEDLVQEACLRALRAMDRLRRDSNVKSWLFTILRNIWLNQLRQRRTAAEFVVFDSDEQNIAIAVDTAKDPGATYLSNFESEQVRAAIQQLPVESQEVILLREFEELSYQEIATLLECPVGTVMSRLARARTKLRERLAAVLVTPQMEKKRAGGTDSQGAASWNQASGE